MNEPVIYAILNADRPEEGLYYVAQGHAILYRGTSVTDCRAWIDSTQKKIAESV